MTQSDCSRHSFNAAKRGSHVMDIVQACTSPVECEKLEVADKRLVSASRRHPTFLPPSCRCRLPSVHSYETRPQLRKSLTGLSYLSQAPKHPNF